MSFRLTTGFSHALREESAKRIAVLAGVSLRTAESWKRDETEPRVSQLRRLMRCDRLAEAVNVWAGRVEAANAVKRAARSLAVRLACWRWDAAISRARWWRRVVERMDGAR